MLEFYLVIKHQHHNNHIPVGEHWQERYVWWGPGAESKAKRACKRLNRTLPGFHYAEVDSVFTA